MSIWSLDYFSELFQPDHIIGGLLIGTARESEEIICSLVSTEKIEVWIRSADILTHSTTGFHNFVRNFSYKMSRCKS